jgi:hypothetical protein
MAVRAGKIGSKRRRGGAGVLMLLVWMLVSVAPAGATALPTTISQDTTLTAVGSPYTGNPTIASGVTLTVNPGARLTVDGFIVKGTLKAEGTAAEPIVFGSITGKDRGEWAGIKLEVGSGASVLDHVEVRNAATAITVSSDARITNSSLHHNWTAVKVISASPQITHNLITGNEGAGKLLEVPTGGAPEIAYNTFSGNGNGVIATQAIHYATTSASQGGEIKIHDNVIEGNKASGITVSTGASPVKGTTLGNNLIKNNTDYALSYSGNDIPGDISKNTAEGNELDVIKVAGTVSHSSVWELGGAPLRFSGTVAVAADVILTLKSGIYIQSPQMNVYGTLRVEGTYNLPVTLTGVAELKGGEWGGIRFEPGSGASAVDHANIGFGGSGTAMLTVNGTSPAITNSAVRRSNGDAIKVQKSGQPTIEGIRFRNNQFGLRYEGDGKLSADRNDWGCANGPKPSGCGDPVTSNVDWQPAVVLRELPRLCPGTTIFASSNTCLLQKYMPTLRLDSEENYLADNAAQITDNWGDEEGLQHQGALGGYTNTLLDGSTPISESAPWGFNSMFPLSLSVLGQNYPAAFGGAAADSDDWLDEDNEYVRDAHLMEEAGYAEAAYGRGLTDGSGKRWLEYWYWYYYNPKSFQGIGVHEGDWESVLVGLGTDNRPEEVVFSQHEHPSRCDVEDVEQGEEGGPVVYVAVDSHANYPKPGSYDAGFITDYADGAGPSLQSGLIMLDNSPGWLSWPGHWGNSRGTFGKFASPTGPAFHQAWSDPAGYAEGAAECNQTEVEEIEEWAGASEMQASSSTASISSVTFNGRQPQVGYRVPGADGDGFWPRLRISVNELGDGGIPPVSKMISNVKGNGEMALPFRLKPGHAAEVLGSIVYRNGGRRVHLTPRKVRSP